MNIKIHIMPNKQFKDILIKDRNLYAILCSSYEFDEHKYMGNNVLKLNFQDVTKRDRPDCFKTEHAERIRKFLDQNNINELYVCCDSGESRSTAIAAAIMQYCNRDDKIIWKNPFYHPNVLVYKILCCNLGVFMPGLRVAFRKYLNERAFRRALKR